MFRASRLLRAFAPDGSRKLPADVLRKRLVYHARCGAAARCASPASLCGVDSISPVFDVIVMICLR